MKQVCNLFSQITDTQSAKELPWNGVIKIARNPPGLSKNKAPCLAPQLSGVKTKASVLRHNAMTALWVDIDDGDMTLDELKEKLIILGVFRLLIYSTASSRRIKNEILCGKKWRILIPLKIAITCSHWIKIQTVLIDQFNGDKAAKGVQQILFAPNNPPVTDGRETQHYEYFIQDGNYIDTAIFDDPIKQLEAQAQAFNHYKPKTQSNLITGQNSVIEAFNKQNRIEDMLLQCGYIQKGNRWLCAHSQSGGRGLLPWKVKVSITAQMTHYVMDMRMTVLIYTSYCMDCQKVMQSKSYQKHYSQTQVKPLMNKTGSFI